MGMDWKRYLNLLYKNIPIYYGAQAISLLSHIRTQKKIRFKRRNSIATIGLKDFVFLLKKRGIVDFLSLNEDIEVIHLHRKNILKRYLSVLRMNQTGMVLTSNDNSHQKRFHVNTENLIASLNIFQEEKMIEIDILKRIPGKRRFTIYYEDYFRSNKSISDTNNMVFQFLGVDPLPVKSSHKKIGSDNLKEYIQNYDEVCSALNGTCYESYLKE